MAAEELGYEVCADGGLEPAFEKIVIYANENNSPTHVARQLPSGVWTSKLGAAEDIEHESVGALEGNLYGKIARFMRRDNRKISK